MKKIVSSYPVISFMVFTIVYSWTLWLLMILSARGSLPFSFPTNFLGSFGPAIGALIVTGITGGKSGIKAMLGSMIRIRASVKSYLLAVFLIFVMYALTVLLYMMVSREKLHFESLPAISQMILYFFIIAVLGGPLGEEPGWRGFLQPALMKRYGPLSVSIIIALFWFFWHIPLFWLEGAEQEGGSMIFFALMVLSMSFLFTILYIESKGSLFLAILFHTIINYVSAYLLPSVLPAAAESREFGHLSAYVLAAISGVIILISLRKLRRRE